MGNLLKEIQRKCWSNVPPKLLAFIGFQLQSCTYKIGLLRKFNRENAFSFITASTISMKYATLVQHDRDYHSSFRF